MLVQQLGERVVLRGRALGVITAITADTVTVTPLDARDGEGGFELPVEHAGEGLRSLVTAEAARAAIAALSERRAHDEREVSDRALAYRRAVKSGDLSEQIRELGAIYHRKQHDHAERQYIGALEKAVYDELAIVLGKQRRALKAAVRSAALGEPPPASLSLPDRAAELAAQALPELAGYRALGPFAIDTKLAVGELAAELTLATLPGIWLAYVFGDVDEDTHHLIAVHRDAVEYLEDLARDASVHGEVTAEGATVSLCDLAQLEDRDFLEAISSEGDGIHGQRCVVWGIGGDGSFPVSASSRNRSIVYVRVDFT